MVGRRTLLAGGVAAGLASIGACSPSPPGTTTPAPAPLPAPRPRAGGKGWRTRVMSFNVLTPNRTAADFHPAVVAGEVSLEARVPAMARWIGAAAPDVVGVQENESGRPEQLPLRWLAPLLPDYHVLLPDLAVPLLVRTAAYAVQDAGYTDISQGHYARHLAWCRLVSVPAGGELLVANTHLDPYRRPEMAAARKAEAAAIVRRLRELAPERTPTVLLGDLNVPAGRAVGDDARVLAALRRAGLRDAATAARRDAGEVQGAASVHDFGTEVDGRWRYRAIRTDGLRYDYVHVSPGITVRTWQVVTGPGVRRIAGHPYFADGAVPSDHCPVQAELSIPAA